MKDKVISEVLDYIKLIAIVLLITTLLNTLVFTFSTVKQSSMENTLMDKDVLIIEKLSMVLSTPKKKVILLYL